MHATKPALARGGQRGPDFRRMVSIIVDHADARSLAFELEAAVHAAKGVKRRTNPLHGNGERGANRNGSGSVQHVVPAWHVQGELAEILLFVSNLETDERAVLSGRRRRSNVRGSGVRSHPDHELRSSPGPGPSHAALD